MRFRLSTILSFGVLVAGLVLASLTVKTVFFPGTASGRQAIIRVCAERTTAQQRSMKIVRGGFGSFTNLNLQAYSAALQRIDAGRCPKKFRLAWLDYVHAWERWAGYGLVGMLRDVGELVPAAIAAGGMTDVSRRWERMNTSEAWRTVERVAVEYGVDLPP
jgi:hypothetical protein